MDLRRLNEKADWVLFNGTVYTAVSPIPVQAIALSGERILCVGSDQEAKSFIGTHTRAIDLRKRTVLPGFYDAHVHPLLGGVQGLECDLADVDNRRAYLDRLAEYARKRVYDRFIRGSGWVYGAFPQEGPNKHDLDRAVPDRPAFIKAIDGHSAWVNSRMLEMAGLTRDTPDPPGGHIERDPRTGEPTGTLREWSAMELVSDRLPTPSKSDLMAGMRAFMKRAAQVGITSIHDPMVLSDYLEAYAELEKQGELTLRVDTSILCKPAGGERQIADVQALRERYTSPLVRAPSVKLFVDGVVEAHSAYLLEPYADRPDSRGGLIWEEASFLRMVAALCRAQCSIHFHAVGDGAIRLALDAMEDANKTGPRNDARHQMAHLDLIDLADIPRLKALNVTANVQPAWFYLDHLFFDSTHPFLGRERAMRLYPVKTMLEAGVRLVCGSDWPYGGDFSTFNPLEAITIGMTRRGLDGGSARTYMPGQRLDLRSLLKAYTLQAAYANFRERETGSLEVGKCADVVVLDANLFELSPGDVGKSRVWMTFFNGCPVFHAESSCEAG